MRTVAASLLAVLCTSVPAAIVGNGIRIFLVSCLVIGFGQKKVFQPLIGSWDLHLFTGAVIFIAAFACLYGASHLLERIQAASSSKAAP